MKVVNTFLTSFSTYCADVGLSVLQFQNASEMLKAKSNMSFSSALTSSSCLVAMFEANPDVIALDLIEMVNDLRVNWKHLILIVETFNENTFKNMTVNYEVTIKQRGGGNTNVQIDYT